MIRINIYSCKRNCVLLICILVSNTLHANKLSDENNSIQKNRLNKGILNLYFEILPGPTYGQANKYDDIKTNQKISDSQARFDQWLNKRAGLGLTLFPFFKINMLSDFGIHADISSDSSLVFVRKNDCKQFVANFNCEIGNDINLFNSLDSNLGLLYRYFLFSSAEVPISINLGAGFHYSNGKVPDKTKGLLNNVGLNTADISLWSNYAQLFFRAQIPMALPKATMFLYFDIGVIYISKVAALRSNGTGTRYNDWTIPIRVGIGF